VVEVVVKMTIDLSHRNCGCGQRNNLCRRNNEVGPVKWSYQTKLLIELQIDLCLQLGETVPFGKKDSAEQWNVNRFNVPFHCTGGGILLPPTGVSLHSSERSGTVTAWASGSDGPMPLDHMTKAGSNTSHKEA
jgi:hypothetical protein